MTANYDGRTGTAGGPAFGSALRDASETREMSADQLAAAIETDAAFVERVFDGTERVSVAMLARFAQALRLRAIEFMQKTNLLSLDVYAGGLDPLYFLPNGQTRYDARIYMREINPRHAVPEGDMTKRNPSLKMLGSDELLDNLGKLEVELTYLLRTAVQNTGGTL